MSDWIQSFVVTDGPFWANQSVEAVAAQSPLYVSSGLLDFFAGLRLASSKYADSRVNGMTTAQYGIR